MDTGGSSREKRASNAPMNGRGREVEDHELFGQRLVLRSPRPGQRLPRQIKPMEVVRTQRPKKRLRSPSFPERRHSDPVKSSDDRVWTKRKQAVERRSSQEIQSHDAMECERRDADKRTYLSSPEEDSRRGCALSLRTYDEMNARFPSMSSTFKLDGVPRLSSLALSVAKTYASRGKLLDLSDLADSEVHEVLGHKDLGAPVLMKLEKLNPSRINILEASWARLVFNEFGESELPPRIVWWRKFYEQKKREQQISLENARARLKQRYNEADASRGKSHMKTTKVLAVGRRKKTRPPSNAMSRIAQLREEVRRGKKKR